MAIKMNRHKLLEEFHTAKNEGKSHMSSSVYEAATLNQSAR